MTLLASSWQCDLIRALEGRTKLNNLLRLSDTPMFAMWPQREIEQYLEQKTGWPALEVGQIVSNCHKAAEIECRDYDYEAVYAILRNMASRVLTHPLAMSCWGGLLWYEDHMQTHYEMEDCYVSTFPSDYLFEGPFCNDNALDRRFRELAQDADEVGRIALACDHSLFFGIKANSLHIEMPYSSSLDEVVGHVESEIKRVLSYSGKHPSEVPMWAVMSKSVAAKWGMDEAGEGSFNTPTLKSLDAGKAKQAGLDAAYSTTVLDDNEILIGRRPSRRQPGMYQGVLLPAYQNKGKLHMAYASRLTRTGGYSYRCVKLVKS